MCQPEWLVEVKVSEGTLSPSLKYFGELFKTCEIFSIIQNFKIENALPSLPVPGLPTTILSHQLSEGKGLHSYFAEVELASQK